jgi:hypothetical protein
MAKLMNSPESEIDAIFLGWQKKKSEDIFPLFNIVAADHPLYQSTVSEATLHRLHLRVPRMSDEDLTLRLNSIWFGRGEQLKVKAFSLAERMMRAA